MHEVEACDPGSRSGVVRAVGLVQGRRAYVERTCDRWFVLSAKHGLVDPDTVIEPYDQALKDEPESERREWSRSVILALEAVLGDVRGAIFECHAGSAYVDHGLEAGLLARGATVERPTEGLSVGRQLAFYASSPAASDVSALPPRPDLVSFQPSPPLPALHVDTGAVVAALLRVGESLSADDLIAIGPDPESDELIRNDGYAFLLGVIFDQGIRYERAWHAPLELRQRLGHLDPVRIVEDPDAVRRAVAEPPALHRYGNNLPAWIVHAAQRVLDEYGADAERFWNDQPTAEELRRRLELFQGIGQKKAAMAVEILERQRGVTITHLQGSDIAFDVHVRRVFLRSGIAERDDQQHMIERARKLHPERPGALDYPAWWIGHEWCRPTDPLCPDCPIGATCPKLIERAIGVSSP
jgi:uncharacterized HhH-GPD family protein